MKYLSGKDFVTLFMVFGLVLSCTLLMACNKNTNELLGTTWILTYDPDSPSSPPDDRMIFKSKGEVDLRDSRDVYLSCGYELIDNRVILNCNVKGKTKQIELKFSENRSILENSSGAKYSKQ